MWIKIPAVRVLLKTMADRKRLNMSAIYNPVTKLLDPMACQGWGKTVTSLFFCDHLHVLYGACRNSCNVCKKNSGLKKDRK